MNYYELEKQATPKPWKSVDAQPSWPMHDNALDGSWFTKEEKANALIAAHCRNHFMEALAVVKHCEARSVNQEYKAHLRDIIAKLENVEEV